MHRLSPRSRAVALPLVLAVMAVSGCAPAQAPAPTAPMVAPQHREMAQVRANTSAFEAIVARRRVLAGGFKAADLITQARLVVTGPDMAAPLVSEAIAYAPSATIATPPGEIPLSVPVGLNRTFTLQALDDAGHVIASIVTLASVASGGGGDLPFNPATDAAGRTLADLIAATPADAPMAATLATTDLTAPLLAFVTGVVGYDDAANTFSGVDPMAFNRAYLVGQLLTSGPAVLESAPAPAMSQEAWAKAHVQLIGQDGRTPLVIAQANLDAVRIDIFDPYVSTQAIVPSAPGLNDLVVPKVVPGTWDVRITDENEDGAVWGKLHVDTTGFATLQVVATPALPSAVGDGQSPMGPAVAIDAASELALVVWSERQSADGRTNYQIKGQFQTLDGVVVEEAFPIGSQQGDYYCYNGYTAAPAPTLAVAYNPAADNYMVAWANGVETDALQARVVSADPQAPVGEPVISGFDAVGVKSGGSDPCDTFGQVTVSVACSSAASPEAGVGDYVIAWNDETQTPRLSTLARGGEAGPYSLADTDSLVGGDGIATGAVAVAFSPVAQEYTVAWTSDGQVRARRFDAALQAVGAERELGTNGGYPLVVPSSDDAGVLVAWSPPRSGSGPLQGKFLASDDAAIALSSADIAGMAIAGAYMPARGDRPGRYMVTFRDYNGQLKARTVTSALTFDNRGEAALGGAEVSSAAAAFMPGRGLALFWGTSQLQRLLVP